MLNISEMIQDRRMVNTDNTTWYVAYYIVPSRVTLIDSQGDFRRSCLKKVQPTFTVSDRKFRPPHEEWPRRWPWV